MESVWFPLLGVAIVAAIFAANWRMIASRSPLPFSLCASDLTAAEAHRLNVKGFRGSVRIGGRGWLPSRNNFLMVTDERLVLYSAWRGEMFAVDAGQANVVVRRTLFVIPHLSFTSCDGRESSLAFYPTERRDQLNSALVAKGWMRRL